MHSPSAPAFVIRQRHVISAQVLCNAKRNTHLAEKVCEKIARLTCTKSRRSVHVQRMLRRAENAGPIGPRLARQRSTVKHNRATEQQKIHSQ